MQISSDKVDEAVNEFVRFAQSSLTLKDKKSIQRAQKRRNMMKHLN